MAAPRKEAVYTLPRALERVGRLARLAASDAEVGEAARQRPADTAGVAEEAVAVSVQGLRLAVQDWQHSVIFSGRLWAFAQSLPENEKQIFRPK